MAYLLDKPRGFGMITQENVGSWWPRCERFFAAACDVGRAGTATDTIREGLESGLTQLWVVVEPGEVIGCAATELIVEDHAKVCRIFSASGIMAKCLDYIDDISKWAKTENCTHVLVTGRLGWQRILARRGFTVARIEMEIAL